MSGVELGFLEKCESWELESRLFPSKAGGKPSWLDLQSVPDYNDLKCSRCDNPMIFLCQIYAPYEQDENNFHRTLFVFVCRTPACCVQNDSGNFRVFRSSLQRENDFYGYDPPCEQPDPSFSTSKWVKLCRACGCRGDKVCAKCKSVTYCCREHQVYDWKRSHQNNCCSEDEQSVDGEKPSLLFSEWDVCTEPEVRNVEEDVDERKAMQDFEALRQQVSGERGGIGIAIVLVLLSEESEQATG